MGFSVCFGFFGGYIFFWGGGLLCVLFCSEYFVCLFLLCFVLFFLYLFYLFDYFDFDGNEVCWIETIMC